MKGQKQNRNTFSDCTVCAKPPIGVLLTDFERQMKVDEERRRGEEEKRYTKANNRQKQHRHMPSKLSEVDI